jgi:hypothetical protein
MKRGSITTYFVVGISIIIVIGLFFLYDNSNKNNQLLIDTEGSASLESEQNLLDSTIKFCVKQTLIEAELEYGLSKVFATSKIEEYMNNNLENCLGDFNQFDKLGYSIKRGKVSSNIEITNEAIVADINYPLIFSRKGVQIKFDKQTYRFSRIVSEKISFEKSTRIVSADGSTIIEIESGTRATLDGAAIDEIGIKLLDRGFNGQSNLVLAGSMAYTGIPHGAEFSKPVKITHFYKDKDIHPTIEEDTLRMGYYDDDLGVWVGIPAKVDPVQNKIEIETTHFSPYGVVLRCGTEKLNTVEIITDTLIKEKCGPCGDEYWVEERDEEYKNVGDCLIIDETEGVPKLFTSDELLDENEMVRYKIGDEEDIYDDEVPSCFDELTIDDTKTECKANPKTNYYGYEEVTNLKGKKNVVIDFSKNGDACVSQEDLDTILIIDSDQNDLTDAGVDYDSKYLLIECVKNLDDEDVSPDDICNIEPVDDEEEIKFEENKIEFEFNLENNAYLEDSMETDENKLKVVDACLSGKAKLTLNGFGIDGSQSYSTRVPCGSENEGSHQYITPISGSIEGICAICTKETLDDQNPDNDFYYWETEGVSEKDCGEITEVGEDCTVKNQLELTDEGCFVCKGEESLSKVKDNSDPSLCAVNKCAYTEKKT